MTLYFGLRTMKKIKNLKHKKTDIHLQYNCPECFSEHWLSLQENQTSGFLIKCECGVVIKTKKIKHIIFEFETSNKKPHNATIENLDKKIPKDLKDSCCSILSNYGYNKHEVKSYIDKAFSNTMSFDIKFLVKEVLKLIGEEDVKHSKTLPVQ